MTFRIENESVDGEELATINDQRLDHNILQLPRVTQKRKVPIVIQHYLITDVSPWRSTFFAMLAQPSSFSWFLE